MTERIWTKEKLILTGKEIAIMGKERTKRVIEAWAAESGVTEAFDERVSAVADFAADTITYTMKPEE